MVRIHSNDVLSEFLTANGSVPIPPYLHREVVESDKERYNNVYARDDGSVAAPTAGLHFTDEALGELGERNISTLTLHVGAGTFMPVRSKGKTRKALKQNCCECYYLLTHIPTFLSFFKQMLEIIQCMLNIFMSMFVSYEALSKQWRPANQSL